MNCVTNRDRLPARGAGVLGVVSGNARYLLALSCHTVVHHTTLHYTCVYPLFEVQGEYESKQHPLPTQCKQLQDMLLQCSIVVWCTVVVQCDMTKQGQKYSIRVLVLFGK